MTLHHDAACHFMSRQGKGMKVLELHFWPCAVVKTGLVVVWYRLVWCALVRCGFVWRGFGLCGFVLHGCTWCAFVLFCFVGVVCCGCCVEWFCVVCCGWVSCGLCVVHDLPRALTVCRHSLTKKTYYEIPNCVKMVVHGTYNGMVWCCGLV